MPGRPRPRFAGVERHHGVRVQSHDEIAAANKSDSDKIVALVDVMLALSLIISLFGIVDTLILSVLERTGDRPDAGGRRLAASDSPLVRYESVLTAYVGGVLGLGLAHRRRGPRRPRAGDAVLVPGRPVSR